MKMALRTSGFQIDKNMVIVRGDAVNDVPERLEMASSILSDLERVNGLFSSEEDKTLVESGPKKVKSLGERTRSNSGITSWASLLLFLGIDILAIGVGFLFLMR